MGHVWPSRSQILSDPLILTEKKNQLHLHSAKIHEQWFNSLELLME